MSYTNKFNAMQEIEDKILVAIVDVALEIGVEADGATPAKNKVRRELATRVARNPHRFLQAFVLAAAATTDSRKDADIKTAIENAWDVMSGAPNVE